MPTEPQACRELYRLLETLGVNSCRGGQPGLRRLMLAGAQPLQFRCDPRPDGSLALTLVRFEKAVLTGRAGPDPLIQFAVFPQMAAAEVTRLVHHSDYVLEPWTHRGNVRPLVMRIALAYARRWLRQLAAQGYRAGPSPVADEGGGRGPAECAVR